MSAQPRLRGQAMLEFALALPVLLLVLVMFLEFGRIVYYYSALNHAVRAGARLAIVNPSSLPDIEKRVVDNAFGVPLALSDVTAECVDDSGNIDATCQNSFAVSAHMDLAPMVGFTSRMLGAGTAWHLHAESVMQLTPCGMIGGCDATPTP